MNMKPNVTDSNILLRDVIPEDLPIFFDQQQDAEANYMAAFTAKDPSNKEAFMAHWHKILGNQTSPIQTILVDGQVAGYVLSYEDEEARYEGEEARPEVSYWLGKSYWHRGIATRALATFLKYQRERPIYARAAKDNSGSLRVLEKCKFVRIGESSGFSNARGNEVEEFILRLDSNETKDS